MSRFYGKGAVLTIDRNSVFKERYTDFDLNNIQPVRIVILGSNKPKEFGSAREYTCLMDQRQVKILDWQITQSVLINVKSLVE